MTKVPVDRAALEKHLAQQLQFLDASAEQFDQGNEAEARRLAATIRILVLDQGRSKSLLAQLDLKAIGFRDTALDLSPREPGPANNFLLTQVSFGNAPDSGARHIAPLDGAPWSSDSTVPFAVWWDKIVIIDRTGRRWSRRDFVLFVAEKEGGHHIDAALDEDYFELTKQNALGAVFVDDASTRRPMEGPELAAVRQIAYELRESLRNPAPPNKKRNTIPRAAAPTQPSRPPAVLPGRNDPCYCGSGSKFKKCHGAPPKPLRNAMLIPVSPLPPRKRDTEER